MSENIITCPFKKVTVKHGNEPDKFGVFKTTFEWCKEHTKDFFKVRFLDDKTIEILFVSPEGVDYFVNILTEYISRHAFVRAIDEIVNQTGVEINDKNKERTYTMCVNIVDHFIHSASFLMHWSLSRFFQNNDTINITIYEKLNLKPLRDDFIAILNQPHALNYIFDSFERVISADGTEDERFLIAGLTAKSKVESKQIFAFQHEDLHVWMNNGKIVFGNGNRQFGVKEILCKPLYESGFNPQEDMTCVKIVGLALLFCGPDKLILHGGFTNRGIDAYIKKYQGVFGEINIEHSKVLIPDFGGNSHE